MTKQEHIQIVLRDAKENGLSSISYTERLLLKDANLLVKCTCSCHNSKKRFYHFMPCCVNGWTLY